MNSKRTIPIAALLTLLIIAVLGTIDRWSTVEDKGVTSEYQEATATRQAPVALREGDRTRAVPADVHSASAETVVVTSPPPDSTVQWARIPGTGIPIWPKP